MEWMQQRIFFVLFLAAVNTGVYLVAGKFGIISWYELHRKRWMPNCTFCLFFWMAYIEILYFIARSIIFDPLGFIFTFMMAVAAAAVSRRLL